MQKGEQCQTGLRKDMMGAICANFKSEYSYLVCNKFWGKQVLVIFMLNHYYLFFEYLGQKWHCKENKCYCC